MNPGEKERDDICTGRRVGICGTASNCNERECRARLSVRYLTPWRALYVLDLAPVKPDKSLAHFPSRQFVHLNR
jgi:hypothetical protein